VCTAFFISSVWHIFVLGVLIGSAQGGIQALSRSYYAKIIPKENSNEFFGFYNIFGKFAAIIGPSLMALTTTLTGIQGIAYCRLSLFCIGLCCFYNAAKGEKGKWKIRSTDLLYGDTEEQQVILRKILFPLLKKL
jgi:UMF1 family MFS transporter